MKRTWHNNKEEGQIMIGFYVGILAVMLVLLAVSSYFITQRKKTENGLFREMAINVANEGFQDGESFFQRQAGGVYLPIAYRPVNDQIPVTGTVWSWPDDAFQPGTGDTDIYLTVTTGQGTTCSAGIIRDIPLQLSSTVAGVTAGEPIHGNLWGRYVIRRQNVRNWTPGGNTADANTDAEACHDITQQKAFANPGVIGSGQWWSITSHGYVYLGSGVQNPGTSDDVTIPASTVLNSLTSSPLATYNNRPLLLASAKVYGEINRISMSSPPGAVYVNSCTSVYGNNFGDLDAGTGYCIAYGSGASTSNLNGATLISAGGVAKLDPTGYSPSVGGVFPGLTPANLQQDASSAGDVYILPNPNLITFTTMVSQPSFYFLERSSSPSTTFTFGYQAAFQQAPSVATVTNVLQGTGLLFVYGNLSVEAGTIASWNGIIFVDGNAFICGPTQIYGQLIATGSVYVGDPSNKNFADVQYNSNAINATEDLVQHFQVFRPSMVVSYN
jgi:hypothetical protein